jgi:hypothetical protein
MNKLKTLEALVRGYLFFRVNGEYFLLYHRAKRKRMSLTGNISFEGYHLLKGWTGFYYSIGERE